MVKLPTLLTQQHSELEVSELARCLNAVATRIGVVYEQEALDHREARGDDSQLFGMKVWTHLRHELILEFFDDPSIEVVRSNGSYSLRVGRFKIGVYKLGDSVNSNVRSSLPEDSPTKRSYGERNAAQMSLFDAGDPVPIPDAAKFQLDDLIVGHFGNPRDGLVKWYVGAPTIDEYGYQSWAWIERQDLPEVSVALRERSHDFLAFRDVKEPSVEVKARRMQAPVRASVDEPA